MKALLIKNVSDVDLLELKRYCQCVLEPNGYHPRLEYRDNKAVLVAEK